MICEMCYLRETSSFAGAVPICGTCVIEQEVDPRIVRSQSIERDLK